MAYTVPKLKDFSKPSLERAAGELLAALEREAANLLTPDIDNQPCKVDWGPWKALRDNWLARKNGILTQVQEVWLKSAPKESKGDAGRQFNELKARVEEEVERVRSILRSWETRGLTTAVEVEHPGIEVPAADLERYRVEKVESVDISLPGIRRPIGAEHPVIKTRNEIVGVFESSATPSPKGRSSRPTTTISKR